MINQSHKISVIVPVYNVEQYLSRCIDSILVQSFTDFELLLIDDGSTDKSGIICNEYAKTDKRIKVFYKKNGGVSSARNFGIDQAICDYIVFVDSDDYLHVDYLSNLIRYDADIVICGKTDFGSSSETYKYEKIKVDRENIGRYLSRLIAESPIGVPWGKLFKHEIINKNNIKFDESLFVGEDHVFVQEYLIHCQSIQFIDYTGYNYFCQSNIKNKYLFNENSGKIFIDKVICSFDKLCKKFKFSNTELLYQYYMFLIEKYLDYQSENYRLSFKNIMNAKNFIKSISFPVILFDYNMTSSKRKMVIVFLLKHKYYIVLLFIFRFIIPLYK